jgi:hypothetical protein
MIAAFEMEHAEAGLPSLDANTPTDRPKAKAERAKELMPSTFDLEGGPYWAARSKFGVSCVLFVPSVSSS